MTGRAARILAWMAPAVACAVVFWPGVQSWFFQDDFAWLGLRMEIGEPADLFNVLFQPKAQGTIRPWSERGFFLVYSWLAGYDALPYRITVLLTQLVNLGLLAAVVRRVTASAAAGFWAALFWGVNGNLGVPMSWTSCYNQVLCGTFLLGALWLFVRYTQTARRRYLVWQWVVFVLGFGALELNVVYPVLAGAYALLCARRYVLQVLPMFAVSMVYAIVHRSVAPNVTSGSYAMHVDTSMFVTLWGYAYQAWGGPGIQEHDYPQWLAGLGMAAPVILAAVLGGWVLARLWRRETAVLFGVIWFLALIAPLLPLRDHVSYYYLTLPVAGLAWLGGQAMAGAWARGGAVRVAALVLALLYMGTSSAYGRAVAQFNRDRSRHVRDLFYGVQRVQQLHPGKVILLDGITSELFWAAVNDGMFRLTGTGRVFLTPDSEVRIERHADLGTIEEFVLPAPQTLKVLEERKAVVYLAAGFPLRNVTAAYEVLAKSRFKPGLARTVDVGHPEFTDQLGEGWYPIEGQFRWMGRRVVVWLGGPEREGQRLHVAGYCAGAVLRAGLREMTVSVNGKKLIKKQIDTADARFEFDFELEKSLVGAERVEVVVEVDKPLKTEGDTGERGLVFGSFSIR